MASNGTILPDDTAASLKCSICEGYLSIGPVMISTDGTKYQCGRCNFTNANINVRNLSYEKVAAYLMFPCIYKGCKEKIAWGSVKWHELSCQFRTFRCIIDNCDDELNADAVIKHFEKCHPNCIMSANTTLPYSLDNKLCYSGLLIDRNVPYFFIEIGFCKGDLGEYHRKLLFNVYTISNMPKKLTYTVTFSSDCETSDIVGKARKMIVGEYVGVYNDRLHCVDCYLSRCNIKFHKYSNFYGYSYEPTKLFEASLILITTFLQSSKIYYCITIEADAPLRIENESLIRKMVECTKCTNYMQAPIYSCIMGHFVCKMCKEIVSLCPKCWGDITTSRNFTLEELCESIRLPCKNIGCHEIDTLNNLQVHESYCKIGKALEN